MRTRCRAFRLLPLALMLSASGGWAQSPAADSLTDLDGLRDLPSTTALQAAVDSIDHPPGGRSRPADWAVSGLAHLALAGRTGAYSDYQDAIQLLEEALRRDSRWAPAWYAIGLARMAMADQGFSAKPGTGQVIGDSYADGAARSLLKALTLDPHYLPAAEALAGLVGRHDLRVKQDQIFEAFQRAVSGEDTMSPDLMVTRAWLLAGQGDTATALRQLSSFQARQSAEALARGTPVPSSAAPVLLQQSQYDLRKSLPDSALISLRRFLALGGDSAVGRHEQARTLFAFGRPELAESVYYEGAGLIRSLNARQWYRYQIHWVARPGEMAQFDSLPPDEIEPWLRAFWGRRDAEDGRPPGSRLAEHFRRWEFALAHYSPPRRFAPRGAGWAYLSPVTQQLATDASRQANATGGAAAAGAHVPDAFRYPYRERGSDDPTLDDRGAIYMRHGPPDVRATYPVVQQAYADTWLYTGWNGNRIFHFKDVPFDGVIAPTTLSVFPAGDLDEACRIDKRSCRIAADMSDMARMNGLIHESRRLIREGYSSDGFLPHFQRTLAPLVQLYGLPRTGRDSARIVAVFSVPRDSMQAQPTADGRFAYPLDVRLSAVGRPDPQAGYPQPDSGKNGRTVAWQAPEQAFQTDTVRTFVTALAPVPRQLISGLADLRVQPGWYLTTLRLSVPGDSIGSLSRMDSLLAQRVGDSLAIPSLLLGREGSGLSIRHAGEEIELNPGNAYRRAEAVALYYFVTGMVPGGQYQTSIELSKENCRPRQPRKFSPILSIRSEAAGAQGVHLIRRTLDVSQLKPGCYQLRVRIKGPGGGEHQVERQQRLNLTE